MAAESVTLVLGMFCVCVCVCVYSIRSCCLAARDCCPPANILNVSAMYVTHSVHQRSSVSCVVRPNSQFAKQKVAVK
jgi:hypothetical protein